MKKNSILVLWSILCMVPVFAHCQGQNILATCAARDFDFVEDIKMHRAFIYGVGTIYKENGNDSYSKLIKYIKKLQPVWEVTMDSTELNRFDAIGIFDNTIFISGLHGNSANGSDATRYLYKVSMRGKVLDRIVLGPSVIMATNLEYHHGSVWVSYKERHTSSSFVIASYHLEDKTVQTQKVKVRNAFPQKVLTTDADVFVLGHAGGGFAVQEPFVTKIPYDGEPQKKIIKADTLETFLDARFDANQQKLYVYSYFDGIHKKTFYKNTYQDNAKYIKVTTLDTALQILDTHRIFINEIGLNDIIVPKSFAISPEVWIIGKTENGPCYLRLDDFGMPVEMIRLQNSGTMPRSFHIFSKRQLQELRNRIIVTNQPRIPCQ